MSQNTLWQARQQSNDFAEICNALYERELRLLGNTDANHISVQSMQGRLKSLSYYINRTANAMTQVNEQGLSPLTLDVQNASWSTKQASKLPLLHQSVTEVASWYLSKPLKLGLVVPVLNNEYIALDSIVRIDEQKNAFCTNALGWFSLNIDNNQSPVDGASLLKPNKKVMMAACAGHRWQSHTSSTKLRPIIPSLRELLLSCAINWKDFKQPLAL